MRRITVIILITAVLIGPEIFHARAQQTGARQAAPLQSANSSVPDVNALAAIVFPGVKSAPSHFGVYLGHGLVLTNWHPWTLDGRVYTEADPPISPSRSVPVYDADGNTDPGEDLLTLTDCGDQWLPLADAGTDCAPFARVDGAGFVFPMAENAVNSDPVPVEALIYANRTHDIALFAVDAGTVEALGVQPAHLSLAPTGADHAVVIAYQGGDLIPATLPTGTPALLPREDGDRLGGPWRVPSLVLTTFDPLPHGGPVFDAESGDLIGLTWRAGDDDPASTWMTPAAVWGHALFAANDEINSAALSAVLAETVAAPVDGAPTVGDPLAPSLGNSGIDVLHTTLDLDFDLDSGTLHGVAALDMRATLHRLYTFTLDANGLEIERVTINNQDAPFAAKPLKLLIQLPEAVDYGTEFQIIITYHADLEPVQSPFMPYVRIGLYQSGEWVFALNQPDGASAWFPCNDHPGDRSTYDFRLRVPADLTAAANGTPLADTVHDDGTFTAHWRLDQPIATYLVVVAVGPYALVEDQTANGLPLRHYVYPDAADAGRAVFSYTDDTIPLFEDLFGPYPFDSYGHIIAPVSAAALETATLSLMPASLLDGSEEDSFPLMAHELSHQWFGDTVTPGTWADIWLNEGFATHAEWLALEERYGPQSAFAARTVSEEILTRGVWPDPMVDPAPTAMFTAISYDKGGWLLHMLRREIGDEVFFTLLHTYFA
ncbi:MAG: hypothetical protein JXQ72_05280, partial [Anaerolineae bacterium]|nr:hypothetical protein [Anaerolineae bacterium]